MTMKKFIYLFFLILVILISLYINTATAEQIKIVTGNYKPYVAIDLKDYGFTAKIIEKAFQVVDYQVEFEFAPWARCEAMVKTGKVFATFPYAINSKRDKIFIFSDVIGFSKTVFFYDPKVLGKSFAWEQLEDLKGYLIGGTRGYFYEPMFKKANLLVDYSDKEEDGFRKLIAGRIKLIPVNILVGWEILRKIAPDKADEFKTLIKPLSENGLFLMTSKRYPNASEIFEKFNHGLKLIKENGVYRSILEEYNIPEPVGAY
jgi:polar amino acid transport system substrate-binding protein